MKVSITDNQGITHTGYVHGSGGLMRHTDTLARLELAKGRASKGVGLAIYEPKPGCVRMFADMHTRDFTDVCLIDATIVEAVNEPAK